MFSWVDNGRKLQGKQIIQSSKSKVAAVCYGPNFLLKYLILVRYDANTRDGRW